MKQCACVINNNHICQELYFILKIKTQLYEVAIIRTKNNLLCYRFHDTVVELGISVITFELVQAIHVSQNVMNSKDCI